MFWLLASLPSASAADAEYLSCEEFAGVGVVPLANVTALVPPPFQPIAFPSQDDEGRPILDAEGHPVQLLTTVVAQSGTCKSIVAKGKSRPNRTFAQLGVGIVPPTSSAESATGNFLQLAFVTDHSQLASLVKGAGANVRSTSQLSFTLTSTGREALIDIDVPRPPEFAWRIRGPIGLPDPSNPESGPNHSVFNYWTVSKKGEPTVQRNVVTNLFFGTSSFPDHPVTLTASGSELQAIVGTEPFGFPFFSLPEVFERTDLTVTVNPN